MRKKSSKVGPISDVDTKKIEKSYSNLIAEMRRSKILPQNIDRIFSLNDSPGVNNDLKSSVLKLIDLFKVSRVNIDKFSDKYLSEQLRELTKKVLHDRSIAVQPVIANLVNDLNSYSIQRVVPIQTNGIKPPKSTFTIGPITFLEFTSHRLDAHLNGYSAKRQKELRGSGITENLVGKICASYLHIGDSHKARESAIFYTTAVLSYLQLCAAFLYGRRTRLALEISSRNSAPYFQEIHVFTSKKAEYSFSAVRVGPEVEFDLSPKVIERLKKHFFLGKMRKILSKTESERTEFEETILRSLSWYADGEREALSEKKVLYYFVALEGLFSKNANTRQSIAHGVAWSYGKTATNRANIFSKIFGLYDLRCDVAHGRKMKITDESDITLLRVITSNAILSCVRRHNLFSTTRELQSWVDAKLLA
jgi:hypothetical protein